MQNLLARVNTKLKLTKRNDHVSYDSTNQKKTKRKIEPFGLLSERSDTASNQLSRGFVADQVIGLLIVPLFFDYTHRLIFLFNSLCTLLFKKGRHQSKFFSDYIVKTTATHLKEFLFLFVQEFA